MLNIFALTVTDFMITNLCDGLRFACMSLFAEYSWFCRIFMRILRKHGKIALIRCKFVAQLNTSPIICSGVGSHTLSNVKNCTWFAQNDVIDFPSLWPDWRSSKDWTNTIDCSIQIRVLQPFWLVIKHFSLTNLHNLIIKHNISHCIHSDNIFNTLFFYTFLCRCVWYNFD